MKNEKIIKFTKLILDIMFFSGIIVLLTVPFTLNLAGRYYSSEITEYYYEMLFVFGISGIFGILIIMKLRKILKTVVDKNCFVQENVKSLNLMSGYSVCICILFVIKLLFLPTPATGIIVLVFFIAAMFSIVLASVFSEAIRYKEENDLMI